MIVAATALAGWRSLANRRQRGEELRTTLVALGGMVSMGYDGPAWLESTPAAYLFERITSVDVRYLTADKVRWTAAKYPEQKERVEALLSPDATPGDLLLEALAEHPNLTVLNLPACPLTDRGVRCLDAFDQLGFVILAENRLQDRHLEFIGRRTRIHEMYLDGNEFTDAGMAHLAPLENLTTLHLSGHKGIGDAGLRELAKLPKLGYVVLLGSSVTAKGVAAITSSHAKDLEVEWESSPEDPPEELAPEIAPKLDPKKILLELEAEPR